MAFLNETMSRNISISIPNPEELILPELKRLSPAEWTLLIRGEKNSQITVVLADILTNIFQKCVEQTINFLLPTIEEIMAAKTKPETTGKINVRLSSQISTEIANVLQASPDFSAEGEELNALMEEEVSDKVTFLVNEIIKTPEFSEEPAVYVSRCFMDLKKFRKLVLNAGECVRKNLCGVRFNYPERYWHSFTRKEVSNLASGQEGTTLLSSEERVMTPSLEESVTNGIADTIVNSTAILDEHEEPEQLVDQFQIEELTEEISRTIIKEISSGGKPQSPAGDPAFNIEKIVFNLKNIFRSRLRTGNSDAITKPEFSQFVKQQFKHMLASVRKALLTGDAKLVKLNCCEWSQIIFPGCTPDYSSSEEDIPNKMDYKDTKYIPKTDYQTIKSQIDVLCAEPLENPFLSDMIQDFAKELTDQLYSDIMREHCSKIPIPPKGKWLSDSVLSVKKTRGTSRQIQICPEVFYARTEDEVKLFLGKIFLWIKTEETEGISEGDKVCSLVSKIDDLVETLSCRTESPKANVFQELGPSTPQPQNEEENFLFQELGSICTLTDSNQCTPCTSEGDADRSASDTGDSLFAIDRKPFVLPKKTPERFDENKHLAFFVMNTIFNCSKKRGGPLTSLEIRHILSKLSGKKVKKLADLTKDEELVKKLVTDICKQLREEYGSDQELYSSMASDTVCPVQTVVLKYLRSHLPKPQPSTFHVGIRNFFKGLFRKK
ncbi:uncharacterized protein LOC119774242 [Cyprinodon tularosa]|uniref:uncharacterized protein LOC119774242 n=1 Tax=Cyprinodon tularosa TaxID=77115 RepID=UPI0018E208E8|nr:uncharacterized protein LOC119774242 [Cyprinodon tularosa]